MIAKATSGFAVGADSIPRSARSDAAASLQELMALMHGLALQGRSVLGELIGTQTRAAAYAHLPADDAHDPATGYRWYYHSHARDGRTPGEHGHFHLFRDETDGEQVSHLLAISVDARGAPLALFAPNAWVSDEAWAPAATVLRWIQSFAVREPPTLARVHHYLALVLRSFAPQVRDLLHARDARVCALQRSAHSDVLQDRRVAVLSRCRIDLVQQAALFERRTIHPSRIRGVLP